MHNCTDLLPLRDVLVLQYLLLLRVLGTLQHVTSLLSDVTNNRESQYCESSAATATRDALGITSKRVNGMDRAQFSSSSSMFSKCFSSHTDNLQAGR